MVCETVTVQLQDQMVKLELREIGRRGLLDTSGSGRVPLVDHHEYVDEVTFPLKAVNYLVGL